MNKKVTVSARWHGSIPERHGKPLPKNQWARAGRRRTWTVRWYAPAGKRPRQTFESRAEAEEFARGIVAEFESKGPQARLRPKHATLGSFVAELLRLRTGPHGQRMAVGTLNEYRSVLNRFADFVGHDTPLSQVSMADATRYLAMLRDGPSRRGRPLSVSSLNKHKRNLKSAFSIAVDLLGYLKVNPLAQLKQDKVPDQELRYVNPLEFSSLTETCGTSCKKNLWWEAFLTVCYTAATRVNEATHLTWSDVDFENDQIRIIAKPELAGLEAWRPKDHDSRTIPVPSRTMDLLTRLHAEAREGSEFVFIPPSRVLWIRVKREAGTWTEGQQVINNLDRDFKRIAQAAGVDKVRLHDLRRSCITHWAKGMSAPVVKELAGHASLATTLKYYVSIRAEDMAEARGVVADALLIDPK